MSKNEDGPTEVLHQRPPVTPNHDAAEYPQPRMFGLTKAAYSVNETLELLSIGRTSLYDLISQDLLRPIKMGRKTLLGADDLAALLIKLRRSRA
jgi:predicted DNA-binding transcriptional regulator AlpA